MDFELARRNMVDGQLRPTKVTDPNLLAVMETLPRESFIPSALQGIAYVDEDVEIAPGRYLMEPVVLARLVQALELSDSDSVLNIGCGTGYDAALLGRLAGPVLALESDRALADQALSVISHLGIDNVAVVDGRLADGFAKQAPFDAILFSGSVPAIPDAIASQLASGGRIAAVVGGGENGVLGRATLFVRSGDSLSSRMLFDAGTPPLPGFAPAPAFVF